jgi:hypothetical protein
MEIESKGYDIHLDFDEGKALLKLIGRSNLNMLMGTFHLTKEEGQKIQSMYNKLCMVVPEEYYED